MRSGDVFPSNYLKAEQFDGDAELTIREVKMETLGQGRDAEEKPIAYFEEIEKGLVLNKTNWALIAKQHGDESDDWVGKKIILTVMDVEFKGDMVQAIRVRPPRPRPAARLGLKPASKPVQPARPVESGSHDDDGAPPF